MYVSRWNYDTWVNYDFFPSKEFPILVYFKETQVHTRTHALSRIPVRTRTRKGHSMPSHKVRSLLPAPPLLSLSLSLSLSRARARALFLSLARACVCARALSRALSPFRALSLSLFLPLALSLSRTRARSLWQTPEEKWGAGPGGLDKKGGGQVSSSLTRTSATPSSSRSPSMSPSLSPNLSPSLSPPWHKCPSFARGGG